MKNGHSKMVQEREKMKKKEKSELSPRAARELKRVLVNTPEDRIQMIKILRRKFYELVKSYV